MSDVDIAMCIGATPFISLCFVSIWAGYRLLYKLEDKDAEINRLNAEIQRLNDILWFTEEGDAMNTDNRGIRE